MDTCRLQLVHPELKRWWASDRRWRVCTRLILSMSMCLLFSMFACSSPLAPLVPVSWSSQHCSPTLAQPLTCCGPSTIHSHTPSLVSVIASASDDALSITVFGSLVASSHSSWPSGGEWAEGRAHSRERRTSAGRAKSAPTARSSASGSLAEAGFEG